MTQNITMFGILTDLQAPDAARLRLPVQGNLRVYTLRTTAGKPSEKMSKRAKKRTKSGKRKLTAAERRARRKRRKKYMTVFINGKQKRVPRPQQVEGMDADEFIAQNADPIWLHQNELWELMPTDDEP